MGCCWFDLLASQMSLVVSEQTGNVPLLRSARPDAAVSCLHSFKTSSKTWLHVCQIQTRAADINQNLATIYNFQYVQYVQVSPCSAQVLFHQMLQRFIPSLFSLNHCSVSTPVPT